MTVLKILLNVNNLNKTFDGGLSSFGLILLTVSYLQMFYSGITVNNLSIAENVTLSDHLLNFLKLYGEDFNYQKLGISVRNGGFYYQRDDKCYDKCDVYARSFLSLENPLMPDVNTGKGAFRYEEIQKLFQKSYVKLTCKQKMTDISILNSILPTKDKHYKD